MGVNTAANYKIFIGSEDADDSIDTLGEYQSESWTEIGEVEDMGEIGDTWRTTEFATLGDSRVRRFKTVKDGGELNLVLGLDPSDGGQTALATAFSSKNNYTFKIAADDAGSGSPSNPTTYFFRAMVVGNRRVIGQVDGVVRRNATLAVNSDLVVQDAV